MILTYQKDYIQHQMSLYQESKVVSDRNFKDIYLAIHRQILVTEIWDRESSIGRNYFFNRSHSIKEILSILRELDDKNILSETKNLFHNGVINKILSNVNRIASSSAMDEAFGTIVCNDLISDIMHKCILALDINISFVVPETSCIKLDRIITKLRLCFLLTIIFPEWDKNNNSFDDDMKYLSSDLPQEIVHKNYNKSFSDLFFKLWNVIITLDSSSINNLLDKLNILHNKYKNSYMKEYSTYESKLIEIETLINKLKKKATLCPHGIRRPEKSPEYEFFIQDLKDLCIYDRTYEYNEFLNTSIIKKFIEKGFIKLEKVLM
jgi:hypothetical protein